MAKACKKQYGGYTVGFDWEADKKERAAKKASQKKMQEAKRQRDLQSARNAGPLPFSTPYKPQAKKASAAKKPVAKKK
jgi:hypothetical protein